MTQFLRLLRDDDKAGGLFASCTRLRLGETDQHYFEVDTEEFRLVPGVPFAYWVQKKVREAFNELPGFEDGGKTAKLGMTTNSDFRFLRLWWEIPLNSGKNWVGFAKGGAFSPFYADIYLMLSWGADGDELKAFSETTPGTTHWSRNIRSPDYYLRPGLTWPRRTQKFGPRVMPAGCIFADKGPAVFVENDSQNELLATLSIMLSRPFEALVELKLNAGDKTARSFEVGIIKENPVPRLKGDDHILLAELARRAWSLKRNLDTVEETSHAFLLPIALRSRMGDYDPSTCEVELTHIQAEIDAITFDLYGFDKTDFTIESTEKNESESAVNSSFSLLSWCVGVAFGRFDWRLATGERKPPSEPEPFASLPAKSPGMLPDDVEHFHQYAGILVDDPGHPHDIVHLIESVQERVDAPVSSDVRRWLQRDFFKEHLKRYSKSRRKAPIYWPLATVSGGYTLWIYHPVLNAQTLYTAVNDFVDPKLKSMGQTTQALRARTDRSKTEERELEKLQDFELELTDLRDTLLQIAKEYAPNLDDGVQISAAPLWPLFRHKPWQNVLKSTWAKLEKGDYDWSHLAMNYWPDRVRDKCKTDKSLAIAHGLEAFYEEPPEQEKKKRGRGKAT